MRATEILFESRAAVLKAEAEAKLLDKQIELERLRLDAAAIRAAALEEAARVCEDVSFGAMNDWSLKYKPLDQGRGMGADECAAAIRALMSGTDGKETT